MEESTSNNSTESRLPAIMKYDDAVMTFADARIQYKNSILKYRNFIRNLELSSLKKLTYADVDQFVPDLGKDSIPQLSDQNEKRKQFIESVRPSESLALKNAHVHHELNMIGKILDQLRKEKEKGLH